MELALLSLTMRKISVKRKAGCGRVFNLPRVWILLLPAALFFGFPQNAQAQQVARPNNTNITGAWVAVNPAGDHYLNIDEVTFDDADYVQVTGTLSNVQRTRPLVSLTVLSR